jgi:hypothetical protein
MDRETITKSKSAEIRMLDSVSVPPAQAGNPWRVRANEARPGSVPPVAVIFEPLSQPPSLWPFV